MFKKLFIVLLLLLNTGIAFSTEPVVLNEIYSPNKIEIYNGKLYVAQETSFFIYSMKDLKLIKKFGRKGEGPGELTPSPYIFNDISNVQKNIFVQSEKKVIYFSDNGSFIREAKKNRKYFKMLPFGKNYVINHLEDDAKRNSFISISLMDKNYKLIKNIYKQEKPVITGRRSGVQNLPMLTDNPQFAVYKDHLYVETSNKGYVFEIYNLNGEKIKTLANMIKPVAINDKDKARTLNSLKNDKTIRAAAKDSGGWENFKKRYNFIFPEFFPMISDFVIDSNKIYIQTFEIKENKTKYIIMDLKGKIIKTVFLPTMADIPFTAILVGQVVRLFKIYNGKFYYLKDNEKDES